MEHPEFCIDFRPLEDGDLPDLHAWLNDPAIVEWWEGKDVSWAAVQRDYGTPHTGIAEHWVALLGGEPIGWIQCYSAKRAQDAETQYWSTFLDLERTGGIDYLIGRTKHRGRGFGSEMIRAFARKIALPRHPEWEHLAAGPFEANRPSCRALRKAGFQKRATLDDPDGACTLMVLDR